MQPRNITIQQKNSVDKALKNFLNVGFKITDNILDEISKKVNAFRLNILFEYRFSNVLRNKKITEDDFYKSSYKTKGKFPMLE